MIPYFEITAIAFGPVVLQVWGIFVSLGIVVGLFFADRMAKKLFLARELLLDLTVWALVGGMLGARLFYVLFYNLGYFLLHPIEVLYFWQGGASSLGGFFGAAVAIWILTSIRKLRWQELKTLFDVVAVNFWLGWGIGRLGCFFIHDHIGKLSNSFLAVQFSGGARFDLGLLESLLGFLLFVIFRLSFKRLIKIGWGYVFAGSFVVYAVVRFCLDFLRATDIATPDARYWFLTPMQWGIGLMVLSLTFYFIWSIFIRQKTKCRSE